jgi:RHS repeat-associated protein
VGQLSLNSELESQIGNWTIDYTYDALNRLTAADTSTGDYYHYTYDAVGNRLSQANSFGGTETTTAYVYDAANRLTSAGGVSYTWDNNGNMTSDGVNTYTYDGANRLIAVNGQSSTTSYAYDGLGDRLQQTVGGQTTTYTLDLNAALTQILSDGTDTYLYGLDRIAQQNGTDTEYYLGDDLNSVRQLANTTGDVTLTRAYDPYGNTILNTGSEQTAYGYDGEYTDSTGQIYLRARMYDPEIGRFTTKDTWQGDYQNPETLNAFVYVDNNPINNYDPTGYALCDDMGNCYVYPGQSAPLRSSTMPAIITHYLTSSLIASGVSQAGSGLDCVETSFTTILNNTQPETSSQSLNYNLIGYSNPAGHHYNEPTPQPSSTSPSSSSSSSSDGVSGQEVQYGDVPNYPDPSFPPVSLGTVANPLCNSSNLVWCFYVRGRLKTGTYYIAKDQLDKLMLAVYYDVKNRPYIGSYFDREVYDTPFWNGYGSDNTDSTICVIGMCYPGVEVNYFAQGMFSAKYETYTQGLAVVYGWKLTQYHILPSPGTLFWYSVGYNYYFDQIFGINSLVPK